MDISNKLNFLNLFYLKGRWFNVYVVLVNYPETLTETRLTLFLVLFT